MIALTFLVVYVFGWLVVTPLVMRWLADNWGRCSASEPSPTRRYCRTTDGPDCRKAHGEIELRDVVASCGIGLAWPLLIAPGAAYWLATRTPTPVGQTRRIEELEKQLGIN